jgi:zinc transport system substrate-binding protein
MNKKNLYQITIVLVLAAAIISGIFAFSFYNNQQETSSSTSSQTQSSDPNKIQASVSIYPAYLIAKEIVGDRANLNLIAKGSGDPHTFEPSSQDLRSIVESDIFLYNGQGFDEWAEEIVKAENVKSLALTSNLELLKNEEHEGEDHKDEEKEKDHKDEEKDHDHGEFDPHFWLSPQKAIEASENIKNEFVALDSQNQDLYQNNYEVFKSKIESLNEQMSEGLSSCSLNKIITSHDAFGYLGNSYNFEVEAIAGLEPSDEPSPSRLAEIANDVKAENIKHILYETQVDDNFARTIASETGAETLVLNSMESPTNPNLAESKTYQEYMLENLSTLQTALSCS